MLYKKSEQSHKIIEFMKLAQQLLEKVETELKKYENSTENITFLSQLKRIYDEIQQMKMAKSSAEFAPSYPRLIVDTWDYNSTLGKELLEFNDKYTKLG